MQKILHIAVENLPLAVNVLAKSLKIYDQSKAVFFLLDLPGIHGNKV